MKSAVLRAGVAVCDITPPAGLDMGGFSLRDHPARGTRDPLYAKALVLDDCSQRVGIVSCDLMGFSMAYDARVRKAVVGSRVLQADAVMIACTHNHAGPATQFLRNCGEVDEKWLKLLCRQIVNTVETAVQHLEPVTVHLSSARANLNFDRRANSLAPPIDSTEKKVRGERDTRVSLVQFRSGEKPVANILHYACHPVTMMRENNLFSAEFCGLACNYVEAALGGPTLFLNGACGNMNPIFYDGGAPGYERTQLLGRELGQSAERSSRAAKQLTTAQLSFTLQKIEVPLHIPSPGEIDVGIRDNRARLGEARCAADKWLHATMLAWGLEARDVTNKGRAPASEAVVVQRITVGELTFLGVSGEVFAVTGQRIRQLIGEPCLVVGFANGNLGYLPPRKEFPRGGYEVEDACKLYGLFGVGPEAEGLILKGAAASVANP